MAATTKNLNNRIVGNYKKLIRDFSEHLGSNSQTCLKAESPSRIKV